ncbi:hypothetical protein GQ457_03G033050 [Hibiscus cannabinus]
MIRFFQVHSDYRDSFWSGAVATQSTAGRHIAWCKPPPGWCKLNSDGAVSRGSNIATYGDVEGRWLMGFSKTIGIWSVLDSKLWGLFEVLLSTWSLNIQCLMVETDRLDAYRLIMELNAESGGFTLIPYILELISRPWEVRLQHGRRSGNTLVDRIANIASEIDLFIDI